MSISNRHSTSNSTDVDASKYRLVQYDDTFYGGQIQQDSSESHMMLIEVMDKDPIVVFMLINSQGVFYLKSFFSFILEKYIVCDACGLRSPSFESNSVLYITAIYTTSL